MQVEDQKPHFAFHTDWITASLALVALLFCLTATGVSIQRLVTRAVELHFLWHTIIVIFVCVWLVVAVKERSIRFLLGLLGLSSTFNAALWIAHVSVAIQTLNAQVMGVVDLVAYIGFCAYLLHWFREKITYV